MPVNPTLPSKLPANHVSGYDANGNKIPKAQRTPEMELGHQELNALDVAVNTLNDAVADVAAAHNGIEKGATVPKMIAVTFNRTLWGAGGWPPAAELLAGGRFAKYDATHDAWLFRSDGSEAEADAVNPADFYAGTGVIALFTSADAWDAWESAQ